MKMRALASWISALFIVASTGLEAKPYRVMDVGREALQALDSDTIRRTGDTATVWVFTRYWQPQPFGSKAMNQVKSLMEFDCISDRVRLRAVHFFADRETPLGAGDDEVTPWNAIIPDAWVMKVRNSACDQNFSLMGQLTWENYDEMVFIHRQMADQEFSRPN